jgi:hypothetical protein
MPDLILRCIYYGIAKYNRMKDMKVNCEGSSLYNVKAIAKNRLIVTGKGTDIAWNEAVVLSDFVSPWDGIEPSKIEFKALWDTEKLFFCFKVYDSEVYIDTTDNTKSSINNSDRVELFFRSDKNLNPYYCLEIDPTPRLMDFKVNPNKQFDFNWNWPSNDIEIKSSIETNYFTVEGAISIESLTKFGLLKDGQIETGIYQAKYNQQQDGNYQPTWITWLNPETPTPDFHIASSFGVLKLL